MATLANCALYPVHLSAKEVVPILKQYKDAGLPIYGETCPHYLSCTSISIDFSKNVIKYVTDWEKKNSSSEGEAPDSGNLGRANHIRANKHGYEHSHD